MLFTFFFLFQKTFQEFAFLLVLTSYDTNNLGGKQHRENYQRKSSFLNNYNTYENPCKYVLAFKTASLKILNLGKKNRYDVKSINVDKKIDLINRLRILEIHLI